jgi:hypothetical protein
MIITTIDGRKVDTTMAIQSWTEETRLSGDIGSARTDRTYYSINTGTPYQSQKLYQSSQRNFYIVTENNYPEAVADSTEPSATFISERQACAWICKNSHALPDCLASLETEPE